MDEFAIHIPHISLGGDSGSYMSTFSDTAMFGDGAGSSGLSLASNAGSDSLSGLSLAEVPSYSGLDSGGYTPSTSAYPPIAQRVAQQEGPGFLSSIGSGIGKFLGSTAGQKTVGTVVSSLLGRNEPAFITPAIQQRQAAQRAAQLQAQQDAATRRNWALAGGALLLLVGVFFIKK